MSRFVEWIVPGFWTAAAIGSAGAAGYFVERAAKSVFLGILVGIVTLIVGMFGPIVVLGAIGNWSSRRRARRESPKPPSPEFRATIEKVRSALSHPRHGVVDLRESDDA